MTKVERRPEVRRSGFGFVSFFVIRVSSLLFCFFQNLNVLEKMVAFLAAMQLQRDAALEAASIILQFSGPEAIYIHHDSSSMGRNSHGVPRIWTIPLFHIFRRGF